jgi:hypothetical protein
MSQGSFLVFESELYSTQFQKVTITQKRFVNNFLG